MTFDMTNTPVLSVLNILPLVSGTPSLVHVELGLGLPVTLVNAVMVVSILVTPNTSLSPRVPSGGAKVHVYLYYTDGCLSCVHVASGIMRHDLPKTSNMKYPVEFPPSVLAIME